MIFERSTEATVKNLGEFVDQTPQMSAAPDHDWQIPDVNVFVMHWPFAPPRKRSTRNHELIGEIGVGDIWKGHKQLSL